LFAFTGTAGLASTTGTIDDIGCGDDGRTYRTIVLNSPDLKARSDLVAFAA